MKKVSYYIDKHSKAAPAAVIFLMLMIVIRSIYYGVTGITTLELWLHYITPVCAAFLMTAVIALFGRKLPGLSILSVFLFVVFLIARAFTFESRVQTVLCITMYLVILTVYTFTLLGYIRTKFFLYPLAGLPLLYHIFVEDMKLYVFAKPPVPFIEWLPELSILAMISALLCVAFTIKKHKAPRAERNIK